MSEEEVKLIRRAKQGDPDAFAELYDRHQPAIYRYISFRVGSTAVAEDLTSEVFVRLVEKIDQFTYRGKPLLTWLYTIARNLITDHHRHSEVAEILPLSEKLVADATDPEKAAGLTLEQQRLGVAIEQLTEGQRQVILLKFFEGLENEDVAQVLDKTVGAVKALQYRGLRALQRIFKKNQD